MKITLTSSESGWTAGKESILNPIQGPSGLTITSTDPQMLKPVCIRFKLIIPFDRGSFID